MHDEKGSYSLIYEKYVDDLYSYGLSLGCSKEDCLDAIHDVFYKLYLNRKNLGDVQSLKAYLLRSMRNALIDMQRKSNKLQSVEALSFLFATEITVLDTLITEEEQTILRNKVEALLNTLTDHQKEVIYLRYMHEMDYAEIGRILNITPESVRKQVCRAIDTMRKIVFGKIAFMISLLF